MNDALVLTEIDPAGFARAYAQPPEALNALSRALMASSRAIDALPPTPPCAC